MAGPEIFDFGGLSGPSFRKNHRKRWGASPPTFSNRCCGRRGRLNHKIRRFLNPGQPLRIRISFRVLIDIVDPQGRAAARARPSERMDIRCRLENLRAMHKLCFCFFDPAETREFSATGRDSPTPGSAPGPCRWSTGCTPMMPPSRGSRAGVRANFGF